MPLSWKIDCSWIHCKKIPKRWNLWNSLGKHWILSLIWSGYVSFNFLFFFGGGGGIFVQWRINLRGLFNGKAILVEKLLRYNSIRSWGGYKEVHTFPKDIRRKVRGISPILDAEWYFDFCYIWLKIIKDWKFFLIPKVVSNGNYIFRLDNTIQAPPEWFQKYETSLCNRKSL